MQVARFPVAHSDPDICGGTLVFVGTRVPVTTLFDCLEAERRSNVSWTNSPPFRATKRLRRWASPEALSWTVRVLFDENLPRDLVAELAGHHVTTVQAVGWSSASNGELLRRPAHCGGA